MIIHASIPADDPERVARVIAELWRGESFPFLAGTFIAMAATVAAVRSKLRDEGMRLFPRRI